MTYTDLIWDFNGTLYDDVQACLDSIDTLLVRYGKPPLGTKERYREVFGFPIEEYYRRAGFDFDEAPFEKLAHEWVELYFTNSIHSGLYPGAGDALGAFRSMGYRHTLLSATELGMLGGRWGRSALADTLTKYWDAATFTRTARPNSDGCGRNSTPTAARSLSGIPYTTRRLPTPWGQTVC